VTLRALAIGALRAAVGGAVIGALLAAVVVWRTPREFGVSAHQALTWFGLLTLLAFVPCLAMEWGRIYLHHELGSDRGSTGVRPGSDHKSEHG
jgi:hypothetical protein